MSLATITTALNELPSPSNLEKLAICTSEKENKNVRDGNLTRAIQNLVSKRTELPKSYDTQEPNHFSNISDLQAAGKTSPLSHLMRSQHPTTRNLFSVRCDGWMCQIGDSIDFHEREISLTSQAIAKLLIIAHISVSILRTDLKSQCRSTIETL
jgi:hypothetical protein